MHYGPREGQTGREDMRLFYCRKCGDSSGPFELPVGIATRCPRCEINYHFIDYEKGVEEGAVEMVMSVEMSLVGVKPRHGPN
jgi:hypothetical protein